MDGLMIVLLIIAAIALVCAVIGIVAFWSTRVFIARCLDLVPSDSFISPCEVAQLHYAAYGHGFYPNNPQADTLFLRGAFLFQEHDGELIGMPNYGRECSCRRVFKLSPSAALKREREHRYPAVTAISAKR